MEVGKLDTILGEEEEQVEGREFLTDLPVAKSATLLQTT